MDIEGNADRKERGIRLSGAFSRLLGWIDSHPGKAGSMGGWYQQACGALAAMISYPLVIKHLTAASAGIWFSFQGILGAINLTDFGLSFVLARQFAYTLHVSDKGGLENTDFIATGSGWEGAAEVYEVSRRFFIWVSLVASVVIIILYFVVMHFGKLAVYRSDQTLIAWGLLGLGTVLSLRAKPSQALIEGCGKVYLARFITGSCQLLSGLAVIGALMMHAGLRTMALSVCGAQAVQWSILRNRALAQGDLRKSRKKKPMGELFGKFFRVAAPMGIMNLSSFLVSSVQVPLLGMVLGPKIVPPFYLAQKIGQMLSLGCMHLVGPQMPLFTRELANAHWAKALHRVRRTVAMASGAAFLANLFFWLGSPIVVTLWLGRNHYIDSGTLGLMSLDYLVLAVGVSWTQFVLAAGRNPFVITTAVSAVANVVLIFLLCPHLGLVGIPLATLSSGLLTNYWYAPFKGMQLMRELQASERP
jgi:O-antigen/teichoic acid export membrane protein